MWPPPAQMKMTAAPHSATFSPPLFVPSSRAANGRARALDFWGMNNHRAWEAKGGQPAGQRVDHVTCSMGRKEGRTDVDDGRKRMGKRLDVQTREGDCVP